MKEISMEAIANILDSFDVEETTKLLTEQIMNRSDYSSPMIDQFQPLYKNYATLMAREEVDDDDKALAREKFYEICNAILGLLEEQFDIVLDEEWQSGHQKSVPAVTMAFYSFFVLDIYANVLELLTNYITKHKDELVAEFKDIPRKPIGRPEISEEDDVIMRNIYDICSYVLGQLTMESAMQYFDQGYAPLVIIDQLYKLPALEGDFITRLTNIFNQDISFKSQIGFDIIYKMQIRIKSGLKGLPEESE